MGESSIYPTLMHVNLHTFIKQQESQIYLTNSGFLIPSTALQKTTQVSALTNNKS